ncbi:M23 family metallopeptidase [Sphingomonas aracearum]|uniref:M23 family peptidase n=1 Tax=Sphingomonas aracearum TaxID=2283317 RepID=A0A369VS58_9SPHN|nr:M23 family metallopeptidase [Sphingomonas aracearum]RDE04709.1 M23 family peptidase [Sphingomonas aracearum]
MFLRNDLGLETAGGTSALRFGRAPVFAAELGWQDKLRARAAAIDWTPDLGSQIGSRDWWRGLATCLGLMAAAWSLNPGIVPIDAGAAPPLAGKDYDEVRAQGIAPLAWGADTGRRMAANDLVAPLAETPERPQVDLTATLGEGDDLTALLQRAGVGREDAARAAALVADAVPLADIRPGTRIDMTLGRRPSRTVARPLEQLAFRARFDLNLSLRRTAGGSLNLARQVIAVDRTPLRIQGLVGSSLYRSARAAGVPAKAVEQYIKAIASRVSIGSDVGAADSFDIILEHARAATGETQTGALLFAGLDQGRRRVQLVKWTDGAWWDASGKSERQGFMGMPVNGRISSGFGLRLHPLLRFMRMHKGLDIAAPWGSPIYAAIDGVVQFAGRSSGYGNFVKLAHGGGIASGYGHMSRIAVRPGQRVARGQVIGFVGSTGMSTGPHLHWEVWKNGAAVNPRSFSFASVSALSGEDLRAFKAKVAGLLGIRPGGR